MDGSASNGGGPRGSGNVPFGPTHGHAALLLVESLMHFLVAKGTLSREDFVEIVEGAAEVEHEFITSAASFPADLNGSLLSPLATAFRKELGG